MNVLANETSVRLWSDVSSTGNLWAIVPHVNAPAGRIFGYRIAANKSGITGSSQTNQAGQVVLPASGTATLANLTMSIGTDEHCDIEIRLFDGNTAIETQTLTLPNKQSK